MMERIGQEFTGFIAGLASFGFFVELDSYFIEGLVRLASLRDDVYNFYEKEYLIKGRPPAALFAWAIPSGSK